MPNRKNQNRFIIAMRGLLQGNVRPSHWAFLSEYLAEVDRMEAADSAEQKARELFDAGDAKAQSLVQVLEKVKKPDQLPLYYSGGFRIMANLLSTGEGVAAVVHGLFLLHHCRRALFGTAPSWPLSSVRFYLRHGLCLLLGFTSIVAFVYCLVLPASWPFVYCLVLPCRGLCCLVLPHHGLCLLLGFTSVMAFAYCLVLPAVVCCLDLPCLGQCLLFGFTSS